MTFLIIFTRLSLFLLLHVHTSISFLHSSSLQNNVFHHCTFSFITANLVHNCTLKQALVNVVILLYFRMCLMLITWVLGGFANFLFYILIKYVYCIVSCTYYIIDLMFLINW